MKFVLVLCLLGLFTGSFAKNAPSRYTAMFKSLVELADDDELDQVDAILNEIARELQDGIDKISAKYSSEEDDFDAQDAALSESISTYQAAIDYFAADLESWNTIAADLQTDLNINLAAIVDAEGQIDAINAQRQADHDDFSRRHDGLQAALEAAQDALELVIEIGSEDLAATLLQINNKKIRNNFEAIHKSMSSVNTGKLSTSMAQILMEATQDSINSDVAGHLVDLIEQLIETLNQEIDDAVANENAQAQVASDAIDGLQGVIDTETAAANENQSLLDEAEANIAADQDALDTNQAWHDDVSAQQETLEANWADKSHNYKHFISRLQGDLDAIHEAEDIIDNNNQ